MTTDLDKMLESKRSLRRELAARPIAEKLRMLDAMRERELAIRTGQIASGEEPRQEPDLPRQADGSPLHS